MAFWKPGTQAPGSTIDRATENEGALATTSYNSNASLGLNAQRTRLPIHKQRESLLYAVEKFHIVIVVGQTGCGKTTQLPQYLYEAGWANDARVIGCTQPRRVAATSVAQRVAQEVGSVLGDEVGYTIRFEDLSSPHRTRIKYLTDGMLFREAMIDPLLSKYSVLMIDEAHERSAYTDLLLGILKKIKRKRPDLRLIISSATIDAQQFLDYFNSNADSPDRSKDDATIISLEGRMFPVEISYLSKPTSDYVQSAIDTVVALHVHQPLGDVLVFLTGREEIDACAQGIADASHDLGKGTFKLLPLPLHAGLSTEQQMQVFQPAPSGTRKIVISTNIAEASVTIEGIKYVVDCGFVKMRIYNPNTNMDTLAVLPASQASINQRAGRAGRTAPGKCFRLFTEATLTSLPKSTPPEICRTDISFLVLQLKALGIDNVLRFDFLTPPPSAMLSKALEFLFNLGALDKTGQLTKPLGTQMAEMPVDPMLAKILLDSPTYQCSDEILTIAAMTQVQNVFLMGERGDSVQGELERRKFTVEEGDHLTLLNTFMAFQQNGRSSAKWCASHKLNFKALSRAVSIRQQLSKYLKRFDLPILSSSADEDGSTAIRQCLAAGYFRNAAKVQHDGTYRSIPDGIILHTHPSSVLFTRTPPTGYVIYHEVVETTKRFIRDITVVDPDWILQNYRNAS